MDDHPDATRVSRSRSRKPRQQASRTVRIVSLSALKQFASSALPVPVPVPVPEPVVLEPALVGPGPGTGVATAITARHLHGTDVWLASQVDNFSATRHLPKCALGLAEP